MAVYKRIQKIDGYTMMSNYHLRDMNLSLKASGLLSLVLSLPADWKYSVSGLTAIVKEGKSAVMSALKELEENGYLSRMEYRENGRFQGVEYIFLEYPGQLEDIENPKGHEQIIQKMQREVAERMQEGMKEEKSTSQKTSRNEELQKLEPEITTTSSPFLTDCFILEYLRCEGNDFHEIFGAQFAGDRTENARALRIARAVENYDRVGVEAQIRAVAAAYRSLCPDDNRFRDRALFDGGVGSRRLYRDNDYIADMCDSRALAEAAYHGNFFCAGVVGDYKLCLHLYHDRDLLIQRLLREPFRRCG